MSTAPIKSTADLNVVRAVLTSNRDRALFELGVNTAFRGSDIIGLTIKDVQNLKVGDALTIKEQKTLHRKKKARTVMLNSLVIDALQAHVADRLAAGAEPTAWLFVSQSNYKSENALHTVSLTRLWKQWCETAGLRGSFGSHTGRKSFGYLSRVEDGVGIELLQQAYGHASSAVTTTYLCIHDDEIQALYMRERK